MANRKNNKLQPKVGKFGIMLYPVYFNGKLVWVTIPEGN
jgi:hypothetical protein